MRSDSESLSGHTTLANKPDYKSFKFSDSPEDSRGFKEDRRTNLKDENIAICDSKCQDCDVDSDPFPDDKPNGDGVVRNVLGVHGFTVREDSMERRERMTKYTTSRSESEGGEERIFFYTDGNVMDSELPELVTFLQKSNYQVVKDIGIDRGVSSQEKCLIENCELDHNIISCLLNSDVDGSNESTNEAVPSISNGSKSSIELDYNKYVSKQCGSKNLMKEREEDIDVRDGSTEKYKPHLVMGVDTIRYDTYLSNPNGHRCEQKFDQVPCKEEVLEKSMVFSPSEVIENNVHPFVDSSKSELKSGSIIHELDSSIVTISSREEEGPQNADCKPPLEIKDMPKLEDMSESPAISSESSVMQHGYAESSISAVGSLSGPIAYSGRSYSGSISLRSNSSTTSIQSFAFPILSTEWNGSPVKMEKADPRQLRKHRRWRKCFLCCKF
ncbi:hypothetical protein L1049_028485 [Liquidambar formosana]|uniref:Uncharacterized protein n=1 Tax=Liquidambar formosana TaxID=63359 RepID=A0AAP0WTC4_LIQFO